MIFFSKKKKLIAYNTHETESRTWISIDISKNNKQKYIG